MVANAYVKKHCKATRQVLGVSVSAFAAAGAALTGIAWFLYVMVK